MAKLHCSQHVARDLAPYVCVNENCQIPCTAFGTFEEWAKHIKEECGSTFEESSSCPLCTSEPGRDGAEVRSPATARDPLLQHIAGHLQSLALNSLPHPPLPSDRDPTSKRSDSSRNTVQNQIDHPHPMLPFQNRVQPNVRFHQLLAPIQPASISRSFVEGAANTYVPQPPPKWAPSHPTRGQAWRPHEGQSIATETFDVLVGEDNIVNQRLIFKLLQRFYHTVVIRENGREALDAFKQRKYDVILMDIQMPVMVSKSYKSFGAESLQTSRTDLKPHRRSESMSTKWVLQGLPLLG